MTILGWISLFSIIKGGVEQVLTRFTLVAALGVEMSIIEEVQNLKGRR
jgi:hypothetical protein